MKQKIYKKSIFFFKFKKKTIYKITKKTIKNYKYYNNNKKYNKNTYTYSDDPTTF